MSNGEDPLSWAGDDELEAPPLPGSGRPAASRSSRGGSAPVSAPVTDPAAPATSAPAASDVTADSSADDHTILEPDGTRHDAADPIAGDGPDGEAVVAPEPMGSVALVIHGVLGGIFLLYTIGWFHLTRTTGAQLADQTLGIVNGVMFDVGLVLAVAAPILWFLAALYLGRGRPVLRVLALVLGALVLVPWGVLS